MRKRYKVETIAKLKSTFLENLNPKISQKNMYPRLQFVNRFFLYNGLQTYYATRNDEEAIIATKIASATMEKFELDIMKIFVCNPKWPICLYDFSFRNKCPTYFCFRVQNDLTEYVRDDYFFGETQPDERKVQMRNQFDTGNTSELLIERNVHLC